MHLPLSWKRLARRLFHDLEVQGKLPETLGEYHFDRDTVTNAVVLACDISEHFQIKDDMVAAIDLEDRG